MRARLLWIVAALAVLALPGCPGSNPARRDGSTHPTVDSSQWPDTTSPYPDKRPPDRPRVDQRRDWYRAADQYVGTPFGCERDSDCFGQKCCPTVWGVKICANDCQSL